jgi:hypothetical protein
MSGSDDQIVGGMCRTSDLTKTLGKLCDSLYVTRILAIMKGPRCLAVFFR